MIASARTVARGAAYVAMLAVAVVLFLLIRTRGEALVAPTPDFVEVVSSTRTAPPDLVPHLLLALAAVMIAGRVLGWMLRAVGQPPVIGEVLAGIALGPSLLGHLAPGLSRFILPPTLAPTLAAVAQIGIVLYMFLVGLELDTGRLRGQVHSTIAVSHASIVVPFVLGAGLALYLYPLMSTNDVAFTHFALFLGVAMSITAFPVLARILSDRGMTRSPLGVSALTCAAVDDVTAWCLLAFVVGVVQASAGSAWQVTLLALGFIAVMLVVVRPLASRWARLIGDGPHLDGAIALTLAAALVAALATEMIGVHVIFGAFILGTVLPHDSPLATALTRGVEPVVTILLLPAFFAFTGMRTEIGLVSGWFEWTTCALIIAVATVGKFGGTVIAARLTHLGWRQAASLGILMNTRGLMELIVLNVGLDLGVISPTLFTMMVVMAVVTTLATTPILRRLQRDRQASR